MTAAVWMLGVAAIVFGAGFYAERAGRQGPSDRLSRRAVVLAGLSAAGLGALVGFAPAPSGLQWAMISWVAAGAGAAAALAALAGGARPRAVFDRLVVVFMGAVAAVAVLTTFGIFLTLIFESILFFNKIPVGDFLFGAAWSPQTAIRADQVASEGAFGVLPLLSGTLLMTSVALIVFLNVGLMSAIYMETYAGQRARDALKLILELLAGVPTVVYGFFALLFVGPSVSRLAGAVAGLFGADVDVSTQNALAAGLVMGVMIVPFVSSLSNDVISAIPRTLKEGAYALGATKSETVLKVLLPAAAPGLIGAFLLAISRAVGETMIVVMAASRSANLTFNPLERVSTMTVQIVALLTGDQEFDSAKTLAAFALGLVLFLITLALNVVALLTVKRFKLRYE